MNDAFGLAVEAVVVTGPLDTESDDLEGSGDTSELS